MSKKLNLDWLNDIKLLRREERLEEIKGRNRGAPLDERLGRRLRLKALLEERAKRSRESLLLVRSFPTAQAFHESKAKYRVIDGSNRSGKTFSGTIEACRAWTNTDPFDKYVPRNGKSLVVGWDLDHIGLLWRNCWYPGAFKIIPDEDTGLWRAVRWDENDPTKLDPYDDAYREKWKDADPLILPKHLKNGSEKSIAWENAGKCQPRYIEFATGWIVQFRSGDSDAPRSAHWNHVWFDEQIGNEQHYSEAVRGLVAIHEPEQWTPRFVWSATPQDCTPMLAELRERADKQDRSVEAYSLFFADNPFIPENEKQIFIESIPEEERDTRIGGVYAITGRRIYQEFDPMGIHGCDFDEIAELFQQSTHYCVLDPGTQRCGTTFWLVDPDEKHTICYGGFAQKSSHAKKWADEVARRQERNGVKFELYVIDYRAGKQHTLAQEERVSWHYWQAMQNAHILPRVMGPLDGFFPGSDNVAGRQEALQSWMSIRADGPFSGTPRLKIVRGSIPELEKEIKRAHMDERNREKRAKVVSDLLDTAEYIAAFNPAYHPPEKVVAVDLSPAERAFREKQDKLKRQHRLVRH